MYPEVLTGTKVSKEHFDWAISNVEVLKEVRTSIQDLTQKEKAKQVAKATLNAVKHYKD